MYNVTLKQKKAVAGVECSAEFLHYHSKITQCVKALSHTERTVKVFVRSVHMTLRLDICLCMCDVWPAEVGGKREAVLRAVHRL